MQPSAKATRAAGYISDCIHDQLQCTPGALFFIRGDFIHCKLELALRGYEQYKCYGNIQSVCTARLRPPTANSDHHTVYLNPIYKTVLKSCKPKSITVAVWSNDSAEDIHCQDIDIATEAITVNIFVLTMWPLKRKLAFKAQDPMALRSVQKGLNQHLRASRK